MKVLLKLNKPAILILIYLINTCFSLNEKCISNFECLDSACCRENECVTSDICEKGMHNIYIAVGVVGLVFLVGTMIYFIASIKDTRGRVIKIRRETKGEE